MSQEQEEEQKNQTKSDHLVFMKVTKIPNANRVVNAKVKWIVDFVFKIFLLQSPNHFLVGFCSETIDSETMITQKVQYIHWIHLNFIFFTRNLKNKIKISVFCNFGSVTYIKSKPQFRFYHFFPISEYSIKLIRCLVNRFIIESDYEIGRYS